MQGGDPRLVQTNLLKAKIVVSGIGRKQLAKLVHMSESTLSAKINGKRPFDADEIVWLCDALGIHDANEIALIFLQSTSQN